MTSIFGSSNHSCGVNFRKEMSSCSTSFGIECHFQNWLPNKFKIKQEGNASIDLWQRVVFIVSAGNIPKSPSILRVHYNETIITNAGNIISKILHQEAQFNSL